MMPAHDKMSPIFAKVFRILAENLDDEDWYALSEGLDDTHGGELK